MTADRNRHIVFVLIAVLIGMIVAHEACDAAAAQAGRSGLAVTNFKDGETLRYPVALLLGTLRDREQTKIAIVNRAAREDNGREWTGIAHLGRFKTLVELRPGKNRLELSAGKAKLSLTLHYRPQTNPYVVRMIYFTDKSGKTAYQTPTADDSQDFRGKFDTALKLMQCFTAEDLNEHGYGRRTFNLELDENGRVVTHIVKGDGLEKDYWEMDDGKLYEIVADAIGKQAPHPTAINLAIMSFTSFDPATKRNRGHTALGGGNLALFGGSVIYTWPSSIADVQRACMDATMTDVTQYASDSIGRNSYWANTSTTTGACLHELGHAFGLPHSADYNGIMVRGIDNFTRKFVFVDPPCAWNASVKDFKDEEIGHWEAVSMAAMAPTRHFALDERPWSDHNTIGFELDAKSGSVTVRSEAGLRFVGVEAPGRADYFVPIDVRKPPRQVVASLADIGRRIATADAELRVVDSQGIMQCSPIKDAMKSSIRRWQFSPITKPWPDASVFAAVDEQAIREITEAAMKTKAVVSTDNTIDFLRHFPADKQSSIAGYAVCVLRSRTRCKIKIHTGSDDGLRLWLNGKLIREVLALRDGRPDAETTEAALTPGKNILLAEVSQAGGGWNLTVRVEDEHGQPIRVLPNGDLEAVDLNALATLISGNFMRTWQFSKVTQPWSGPPGFAAVDAAKLKEIVDSALQCPAVTSSGSFIEFAPQFAADKRENVAGYVVRKLTSSKVRKIRLWTGSDDALRVWLNGKVVQAVPCHRDAKPDSEHCDIVLPKGESTLVAEVSQGNGGWGLYLRIQDGNGGDLAVASDGRVVKWPDPDCSGKKRKG